MTATRWQIERLRASLAAAGDVAYDWDLITDGIAWFDGAAAAFGLASEAAIGSGRLLAERVHPDDRRTRDEALSRARDLAAGYDCEYRVALPGPDHRWVHDRGTVEFRDDGNPVRLRGVLRLLKERAASAAEEGDAACRDPLTGHFNRARLREALDDALECARLFRQDGAYMVVGIDKLTMVNQAFGHEVADSVIVALGDRLELSLRASDVVGRVDGDRFGVVLAGCPSAEAAAAARKILETARDATVDTPSGPIHVTVSIGLISFPDSVRSAPEAMAKADIALQAAKQRGRDCLVRYSATEEQRLDHQKTIFVAEQVQRALRENRLAFAYQPIVDAQTLMPRYHECLLRLVEPGGEIVPAGAFMPVAESLGLIRAVDRRVMEMAVDQLAGQPGAQLALNVSGLTTSDRAWLRGTVSLLRGRPDLARRIIVEITETAGLEDLEACVRFVSTLRELGCRVALDDFGAGYTSFRHLKRLAVDIVKIDGSFIRRLHENEENLVFVRTLLDLARSFNLTTVAEWVETMDEVRILRREGVHMLQGYAFGQPSLTPPWEEKAPAAPAAPARTDAGAR